MGKTNKVLILEEFSLIQDELAAKIRKAQNDAERIAEIEVYAMYGITEKIQALKRMFCNDPDDNAYGNGGYVNIGIGSASPVGKYILQRTRPFDEMQQILLADYENLHRSLILESDAELASKILKWQADFQAKLDAFLESQKPKKPAEEFRDFKAPKKAR